jgi:hypothetical protein
MTTTTDTYGLILCTSPSGWSLHAPGATDEQIRDGDAPPLLSGEGRPTQADYDRAWAVASDLRDAKEGRWPGSRWTGRIVQCPDCLERHVIGQWCRCDRDDMDLHDAKEGK